MNNKYFDDIFIKNYPSLDLHGETSDCAISLIKEFINVSHIMEKDKVIIIHGKSGGTIKKVVHNYLKTDKKVDKYYIYNMNDGITIVELKHR